MQVEKKRICIVVSQFGTARGFLRDHILILSSEVDVYLVGHFDDQEMIDAKQLAIVECKSIPICRNINLYYDLKSVFELRKYFKQKMFSVVHSVTPKAGLINSLAGRLANIENRVHIFTGQVWHTHKGLMKLLLITFDKLIAKLNTHILVDGESQRQFLIQHKVIKTQNSSVLGKGSISGVNVSRFTPSKSIRDEFRRDLNLKNKVVFSFLGRLNVDKGILNLFEAFNTLCEENDSVHLLIIGWDEANMIDSLSEYPNIKQNENFTFFGPTLTPEKVLQAADVFCLPSYREGFGTSVLEASCLRIPVICSDTYGLMDAMINDVTGLRHEVGNSNSLFVQMKKITDDIDLRERLGENGEVNIHDNFSGAYLSKEWLKFYKSLV
ncbi:glycosyltransferase [Ancylomarina sp. 16SWW S1-10-2]|uniref:glycosyltransferase n=1 Tax=Ancylomarina sp. 16SWW S1-10-2 TaxID=2499681 RepID=UPI0012AE4877|nr:glycosyltransferase [Ancylomarina sp. 16SWW S1-10-2]MRT93455.1 glycosyltransferase family 1 protein [Ancylomarina sp. 16SWW S1-10-2]